ncbi:transcriptional regulator, partial [Vibrio parahaemolyticus]
MSELFDVPKATFSAWNTHNRTSHELMVRLHLAKGIPIERMALSGNELNKIVRDKSSANNPLLATSSQLFQE